MEGGGDDVISSVHDHEDTIIIDLHSDEQPHDSDEHLPPPPTTGDATATGILTDDLRDKIIKQVEYYMSDENLRTDKFLLKYLAKDEEGYVPVAVIASFKKMKKLTHHKSLVVAALNESSLLTLSSNEKKVKRVHPFCLTDVLDPELCTILVENLPEDHTVENMKKIFGEVGTIKKITVHEENSAREPTRKCSIEEKLLSGKLHAVVQYETVEAAEKAVATLNNEQDWRHGMRVKLLKRRVKNAEKKKGHDSEKKKGHESEKKKGHEFEKKKGHDSEKKSDVQIELPGDKENQHSSEHHVDTLNEEEESHNGEHKSKDKNGNKGQNWRRSRKHKYQGPSGMGHGITSHNHGCEVSKPPPGPKMPDGTRGFTMGRGKPLS